MNADGEFFPPHLYSFVRKVCLVTFAVVLVGLAGWQFNNSWMKSGLPSFNTMKPVTAVCFLLCATVLWRRTSANRLTTSARLLNQLFSLMVIAAGAATLLENLTGWNGVFEELLFKKALLLSGVVHPGRMSSATAIAFVLFGLALLANENKNSQKVQLWQLAALAVIFSSLVQFLGYCYGTDDLNKTFSQNPMAVQTAFLFLLLGFAVFGAKSGGLLEVFTSPLAGGLMARRILPAAILIPPMLGWLRLRGEHLDLYQPLFGMALFATVNVFSLALVTWFGARSLNESVRTLQTAHINLGVSEERMDLAVTGGSLGTWSYTIASGQFVCSNLFRQICGIATAEALDLPTAFANVHTDDRETVMLAIRSAETFAGKCDFEFRVSWPDGSEHWTVCQGRCFANGAGQPVRLEGIAYEITHRKLAEVQAEMLAAVVESSDDAIITKNLSAVVTSWNPGAERIFGYSAEEMIGRSIYGLTLPGDEKILDEALQTVYQGQAIRNLDTHRITKSGAVLNVSLTLSPLRNKSGAIVGVSSITRDVTGQLVVEQELRQAQKMEAVGKLAGGVAHDFNNLVMVVNSYAQLILDDAHAANNLQGHARQILAAGQRAAKVTRQLLAFSRKQKQDLKVIDLNEMTSQFCKMLPHFIGEDIDLVVHAADGEICAFADQGQYEQMLMNLVVNARDAMPDGGRLTVSVVTAEVDEDYCLQRGLSATPGNYAVISVRDTGMGMDTYTQAHAFEPFFTTKETGKGTGLGLATVYGLVKQHKGMVWIYSEIGVGTEFKIYLPQCSMKRETEVLAARSDPEGRGTETVMLVEDEAALREAIGGYLRDKGYHVLAAENGVAAEAVCKEWSGRIDVLVTDFVLPGIRGSEIAKRVLKIHPEAAVIIMSGYADRDFAVDGVQSDLVLLQKPFNLRLLAQQIRASLRDRGNQDAYDLAIAASVGKSGLSHLN